MTYQPPPWQPPPRQSDEEKAGLFKAGKVAIWMWIALTAVVIAIPIVCCGLCGLGWITTPTSYQ